MFIRYKTTPKTADIFDTLDKNIAEWEKSKDPKVLTEPRWEPEYYYRLGELLLDCAMYDMFVDFLQTLSTSVDRALLSAPLFLRMKDIKILSADEITNIDPKCVSHSLFWTSTPGTGNPDNNVMVAGAGNGTIGTYGYPIKTKLCVRPALVFDRLDDLPLEINKTYIIFGTRWDYIGNNTLWWRHNGVQHIFDNESNDYSKSSLKKYVESGRFANRILSEGISSYVLADLDTPNVWVKKV